MLYRSEYHLHILVYGKTIRYCTLQEYMATTNNAKCTKRKWRLQINKTMQRHCTKSAVISATVFLLCYDDWTTLHQTVLTSTSVYNTWCFNFKTTTANTLLITQQMTTPTSSYLLIWTAILLFLTNNIFILCTVANIML